MHTELGDKFKAIERMHSSSILPDGWLIVRLDGKAFHTYTKGLVKPFDGMLHSAMNNAVYDTCRNSDIPVKFAYTQSDEISLLIDEREHEQGWFGGKVEKIVSVSASTFTGFFNAHHAHAGKKPAVFDARVIRLTKREDVLDYFLWRKADANRNAISMQAQSMFSHKELQGKNKADMLDMIREKNPDVLPIPDPFFNGRYFYSEARDLPFEYYNRATNRIESTNAKRRVWKMETDNGMLDLLESDVLN
jgi:tRNA(His) 5'-end guanylyltransferase